MPATTTNLTVEQGSTWSHGWRVTFNDAPIDATWTFQGMIRARVADATVLHTWTGTVTALGDVVIGLTPAQSSAFTWHRAVYDVEVTKAGVTLRVAEGTVTIKPEVTRP